ncbi:cytochrome c [Ruegeria sediminis]|uniref:Cytochrome c n=2 Tax=Ruegeria sediminis TaxID=2583820 RepID=A0ABY2WYZ0_9RHOB|nr:cytochrome c [Ruegeria sediminis]
MIRLLAAGAIAFLPFACAVGSKMPTPHEGEALFAANCAACHDYAGTGGALVGGQAAPDLTRIAERNGGVFPRAEVLSQIDGYGRGKVSEEVMPEFGTLLEGDLVPVEVDGVLTPTPRPLAALLAYLESIQVSG